MNYKTNTEEGEKEEKCEKEEQKMNQEERKQIPEVDLLFGMTHIFNKYNSSGEL